MPGGLQDWVNRWIRVNSNHPKGGGGSYQFPDDEELSHHRHVQIRHVDGSLSGSNANDTHQSSSSSPSSSPAPPPGPPGGATNHHPTHHATLSFRTADTNDSPDSGVGAATALHGGDLGVALQAPAVPTPPGPVKPPSQNGGGSYRGDYARGRGGSGRFRRRARPRGGGGGGGGLSHAATSWSSSSGHRGGNGQGGGGAGGDTGSSEMSMSRSSGSSRGRLSRTNSESDLLKIKFLTAKPNSKSARASLQARQKAHDELMHRSYHGRMTASPSSPAPPPSSAADDGGPSQSHRVFPPHADSSNGHQHPHHHILRQQRDHDDPSCGPKPSPPVGVPLPSTKNEVGPPRMPAATTATPPPPPASATMNAAARSHPPSFLPPAPRRRAPPPPPVVVAREGGSGSAPERDPTAAATTPVPVPVPAPRPTLSTPNCGGCRALERTVLLLRSDLVYLRSMALANENGGGAVEGSKAQEDDSEWERSSPASSSDAAVAVAAAHPATVIDGDGTAVAVPGTDAPPPPRVSADGADDSAAGVAGGHRSTERRRRRPGTAPGGRGDEIQEVISLGGISRRLEEATVRQREQVEELSRERLQWQDEVEQKTSKLTLLCKELNEESSIRREDVISLERQLAETTADRNALASEVEALRTKLGGDVGKLKGENERLRSALGEGHARVLDRAEAAVRRRDDVIEKLTRRLARTAETLGAEREQHRQRRQIIFPNFVSAAVSQHSSPSSSCRSPPRGAATAASRQQTIAAERDLARARGEAREAKAALGEFRAAAERRERELQEKCDAMARKLRVAQRSFSPDEFECGPSSQ